MKGGFENKREVGIMVVLLLIAAFTTYKFMGQSTSAATPAAAPTTTAQKASTAKTTAATSAPAARRIGKVRQSNKKKSTVASLDPSLHFDWLKASEEREYKGPKRNIFALGSEPGDIPTPNCPPGQKCGAKPKDPAPQPPRDLGPPPPPSINIKFFGFASKPGESKKVFLSQGDDVFIAAEGEIVNKRYKIVKIGATSIDVEDVLNNNKQTIPLSQG
jgi:hypothetical protein